MVRRPVRGIGGPGRHSYVDLLFAAEIYLKRHITYITNDSATLDPLGASGLATYKMVDVNLHYRSILFFSGGNYTTG